MKKFKLVKNKLKNWILKLISLTLATMLWYFVVGEDQVDINIKVPIEILNLPANLTHLTLGSYFNHPVENLPANLTHITFGRSFIHPLNNLPAGLRHLVLHESYRLLSREDVPAECVVLGMRRAR